MIIFSDFSAFSETCLTVLSSNGRWSFLSLFLKLLKDAQNIFHLMQMYHVILAVSKADVLFWYTLFKLFGYIFKAFTLCCNWVSYCLLPCLFLCLLCYFFVEAWVEDDYAVCLASLSLSVTCFCSLSLFFFLKQVTLVCISTGIVQQKCRSPSKVLQLTE